MMETRELTCIGCPMGCHLTVTMEDGNVTEVTGNSCKIGDNYARKEVTSPTRIVTGTMPILGPDGVIEEGKMYDRISVKTASDVPKSAIFEVMEQIHHTYLLPRAIKIGDTVIENVAGTGVNVIATKNYEV